MPSVEEFKESLRDMPEDELDELIDTTRNNRTSSESQTQRKKKKEKEKSPDPPEELPDDIGELTQEQAQALLDRLQNS